ncbi:MAG: DVUA0089 family protein [Pirellulales bacterium]|nr:DVUA0089 family protein [Pirellulales bacterium]
MERLAAGMTVVVALQTGVSALGAFWTEAGDAGQLLPTAQVIRGTGRLDQIAGTLAGDDDVDLYRIRITDPDAFSITVSANLSTDNDAQLFLFDSAGYLVADDDDSGYQLLPQINAGVLSAHAAGIYHVAIDLYNTDPVGSPLSGWHSRPEPRQTGPYTMTFTGAAPVPEPATQTVWPILGALAIGYWRRRRKTC